MRVLIVDDDPWISDLLKQLVLSLRPTAEVLCREDVTSGFMAWQSLSPVLIVADWNLPDATGLTLLRRIRQHDGQVPMVMITGRSDRDSVMAARPLNISAYFVKPFDIPKVLQCLDGLLPQADDDQPQAPAEDQVEDLLRHLANLSPAELDLPLLADTRERIELIAHGADLDETYLADQWRYQPTLCAFQMAAANSPAYAIGRAPCTHLEQAIRRLGGRTSVNLAMGLVLRQRPFAADNPLMLRIRSEYEASVQLAQMVERLARQARLVPEQLRTAALLHRLGELAVLHQLLERGGEHIDEVAIDRALGDFSRPFAFQVKVHWRLPMVVRNLIGAVYDLPRTQVHPEQVLMRLAAAQINQEPEPLLERLRRLAGLA